jgi:hypothetical protein
MLHKNTYLLLILSVIFSTTFAQKNVQEINQTQFVDEHNPSLWSKRKIKLELVKLKKQKWMKEAIRDFAKSMAVGLPIGVLRVMYKRICDYESIWDLDSFLAFALLEFGVLGFKDFMDNSLAWTQDDIDDLQKEVDQRNS